MDEDKIEWIGRESKYGRNVHRARIPQSIRQRFTDQQLVNIADGHGDLAKADSCFNFGGNVRQVEGDVYEISVYID